MSRRFFFEPLSSSSRCCKSSSLWSLPTSLPLTSGKAHLFGRFPVCREAKGGRFAPLPAPGLKNFFVVLLSICYHPANKAALTTMDFLFRSKFGFLTVRRLPMSSARAAAHSHAYVLSAVFILYALALTACSSGSSPLVIKLYHPETKQSLTCAAKDELTQSNSSVLASAVETCARHLETQGFVREK